jgi:hypothetical protein
MLSKTPLTFNYEEVTLKELDDLSSLEKVLFNEFIIASYSNMDSQRLAGHHIMLIKFFVA